jgi:hypothetical protein
MTTRFRHTPTRIGSDIPAPCGFTVRSDKYQGEWDNYLYRSWTGTTFQYYRYEPYLLTHRYLDPSTGKFANRTGGRLPYAGMLSCKNTVTDAYMPRGVGTWPSPGNQSICLGCLAAA